MNKEIKTFSEKTFLIMVFFGLTACFFVDLKPQEINHSKTKKAIIILFERMNEISSCITQEQISIVCSLRVKKLQNTIEFARQESDKFLERCELFKEKQELVDSGVPEDMAEIIINESQKTGVPCQLLAEQIRSESQFDCDAVSSAGAYGPCQIRVIFHPLTIEEACNPQKAIPYQAWLMRKYYYETNSWWAALVCYNAGPTAYWTYQEPESSHDYADKILSAAKL